MKNEVRLPNDSHRISIIGMNGTGKTQAGVWHISRRNFESIPWIIYDYKIETLINNIERAEVVGMDFVPNNKTRGLYIVQPRPEIDDEEVEAQMWKLLAKENLGIYVDEGYMVKNAAMNALLTQGRSKHIPMIVLSQRPVWMSRFVFSESNFVQTFFLGDERDRQSVSAFVPPLRDHERWNLPDFHSNYFDVARRAMVRFSPVPKESEILEVLDNKLRPPRRKIL
jgi:hypothetical protein